MLYFVKRLAWLLNASGDNESVNCSTSLPWVIFISPLTLIVSETSVLFTCEDITSVFLYYTKRE